MEEPWWLLGELGRKAPHEHPQSGTCWGHGEYNENATVHMYIMCIDNMPRTMSSFKSSVPLIHVS